MSCGLSGDVSFYVSSMTLVKETMDCNRPPQKVNTVWSVIDYFAELFASGSQNKGLVKCSQNVNEGPERLLTWK